MTVAESAIQNNIQFFLFLTDTNSLPDARSVEQNEQNNQNVKTYRNNQKQSNTEKYRLTRMHQRNQTTKIAEISTTVLNTLWCIPYTCIDMYVCGTRAGPH